MKMNTKRLTFCALLTAIALTIFMVESQIPLPVPIPNFKLGLSNIVTVYAMFALGPVDTLLILVARIIISSAFSSFTTIFFSLAGGLLCYLIMLPLHKILTTKQLWVCGAIGAIFHNIGQIGASIAIYRVPRLIVLLPFLMVTGIIAGAFTGLAAQFLLPRIEKVIKL